MIMKKVLQKAKEMHTGQPVREPAKSRPVLVTRPLDGEWKPPEYTRSSFIEASSAQALENRCVCIQPDAVELEAYKVLRTRIQQAIKAKGWNTLLVTSPNPGDGKTLTAVNLALTFAKAYNQTVMLVDCDLRRQSIHRMFGLESAAGLVDFLIDDRPLEDFIIWPGIEKLTLISGGRSIQNSAEVLGSERMKQLVHELKTRYDDRVVIIDSPPLLSGADTLALAPWVDAIVMVVKASRTPMRDIHRSLDMIGNEKFLGFVLNSQRNKEKVYYY
jgi:non-specific protein-tyrosine kinase